MGIQPSGSKTDLLLQCARPFAADVEIEWHEASEAARYGSAFHLAMASIFTSDVAAANPSGLPSSLFEKCLATYRMPAGADEVAGLKEHVEAASEVLAKWLAGENIWDAPMRIIGIEQSLVYYPADEATISVYLDEATHTYTIPTAPTGVRGLGLTFDILFQEISGAGRFGVLDHKTGAGNTYATPSLLGQMRTMALATKSTLLAILDTPPHGFPTVYAEEWAEESEREAHRMALVAALDRAGDGSLRRGKECRYCPARHDCPARGTEIVQNAAALLDVAATALVQRATSDDSLTLPARVEAAGKLHLLLNEFDRLSRLARPEIRAIVEEAAESGVEVVRPDGKALAFNTKTVERLSKKSVLEGLGKVAGKKMLEKLRAAGALSETEQIELRAR